MSEDKEYVGTLTLGAATSTQDREGQVVETRPVPELSEAEIPRRSKNSRRFLSNAANGLSQKHGACRSNKLARQGKVSGARAALRHVYRHTIDRIALPEIDFSVLCSKGFYVRTYAHDIAKYLAAARI